MTSDFSEYGRTPDQYYRSSNFSKEGRDAICPPSITLGNIKYSRLRIGKSRVKYQCLSRECSAGVFIERHLVSAEDPIGKADLSQIPPICGTHNKACRNKKHLIMQK